MSDLITERLILRPLTANPASIRVLEKAGLRRHSDNGETLRYFA